MTKWKSKSDLNGDKELKRKNHDELFESTVESMRRKQQQQIEPMKEILFYSTYSKREVNLTFFIQTGL